MCIQQDKYFGKKSSNLEGIFDKLYCTIKNPHILRYSIKISEHIY